jgi:ABC-type proline/glycine betaine transport system permease subunit
VIKGVAQNTYPGATHHSCFSGINQTIVMMLVYIIIAVYVCMLHAMHYGITQHIQEGGTNFP